VPRYILADLGAGTTIAGPAIIIDNTNTIVIENDCTALITENGDTRITIGSEGPKKVG
jgi:5-oxoprolinase (ATP-hydrolysing)